MISHFLTFAFSLKKTFLDLVIQLFLQGNISKEIAIVDLFLILGKKQKYFVIPNF